MDENSSRQSGPKLFLVISSTLIIIWSGCILTFLLGFSVWNRASWGTKTSIVRADSAPVTTVRAVAPAATPMVIIATPEGGDYESAVLKNLYVQVNPSVVNITALNLGSTLNSLSPHTFQDGDLFPASGGSGFVWDELGHIITNHHVVDGANQLQVTFDDGAVAIAEIIGVDVSSDLAVLQVDPDGYFLRPVRRGQMAEVTVGMRVAAIGNPFGLAGTMTSGIVSALGRSIPASNSFNIPASIQTDAAINPGNSGGPLLNEQGEVIGINAQIRSDVHANSGVGFAIPIAIIERVVPALIEKGAYQHSYMGVSGSTLSPVCADELGLDKKLRGAYISEVLRGTPAAHAGLQGGSRDSTTKYVGICPGKAGGDVILAINNQRVSSFDDVLAYLEYYTSPGDTVTLQVLRDGQTLAIAMTLAPRPDHL
ncbi:MAG: trypsin-like peptidase domain-containing protein [Caldilineaceae bacterium]